MVLGFSAPLAIGLIGLFSILTLVYAAEVVVSKMEGVAKYYGISEVVIAMTIVSVGTSLPEITLHFVGSLDIILSSTAPFQLLIADPVTFFLGSHAEMVQTLGQQGIISAETVKASTDTFQGISGTVTGASIGSDVVQETLVIGLVIISSAMLAGKHSFRFSRKFLIRDYAPMMGTTFITLILALNWRGVINFLAGGSLKVSGTLTRLDGLILVGSFVAYMYYLYVTKEEKLVEQGSAEPSEKPLFDLGVGLMAIVFVVVSAEIFLQVVEVAVEQTGLSGSMIGVAAVGVVSALPEMITAIVGLRQGSEGVSLGTLVGSNITNPLLAIGGGAVISTYAVPRPLVLWDLPMETLLAGIPVIYMFSRSDLGNFFAKPFHRLGLDATAEKLEEAENRVLSLFGAFILVLLYFFYLYVRFKYFKHDFVS